MDRFQNVSNTESEYVWYACYGSNLSLERFLRYIDRCSERTPPVEDRPYVFNHNIYFAKHTITWNGAKAFLDDTAPGLAYGRIYKVTRAQYEEIWRQEGNDYRKKVTLGTIDKTPVYSFTDWQKNERKMPSEDYYNVILKGLKECYAGILDESEMVTYLNETIMSAEEFAVVKEIRNNTHYLSANEAADRTGLSLAMVKAIMKRLVELQVIRQDRRSIAAGHRVDDENAFFYTENTNTGRDLINAMLAAIVAEDTVLADTSQGETHELEGARRNVIATRIERSPRNRAMAIAIHGIKCQACGFDFEKVYGSQGKGYIEVHHVNQLANHNGEQAVNPQTDLVCLCANCHRMVHRNRTQVLSIDELKQLICASGDG